MPRCDRHHFQLTEWRQFDITSRVNASCTLATLGCRANIESRSQRIRTFSVRNLDHSRLSWEGPLFWCHSCLECKQIRPHYMVRTTGSGSTVAKEASLLPAAYSGHLRKATGHSPRIGTRKDDKFSYRQAHWQAA